MEKTHEYITRHRNMHAKNHDKHSVGRNRHLDIQKKCRTLDLKLKPPHFAQSTIFQFIYFLSGTIPIFTALDAFSLYATIVVKSLSIVDIMT